MPPRSRRYTMDQTAIERLRIAGGWTQEDLAKRAGISLRTLQRIETRETSNPPIRYLGNLAIALGCEIEDLIEPAWRRFWET